MGKLTPTLVACVLAVVLGAPASGAPSDRKVTKEYTMANGMVIYESTHATWDIGTAWKTFRPQPGEQFVSFSVSDDTGQPVYGHIHLDDAGGKRIDREIDFCNETQKPIRVDSTRRIEVAVFLGTCPNATPSVVTQGTITATFTK